MSSEITAQDVFRDIEFELLQGAIRQDEIGQSIQSVRQFHNSLRTELLAAVNGSESSREIVARQTQFNDMLLTVIQEMSGELLQLRNQQRALNGWTQQYAPAGTAAAFHGASASMLVDGSTPLNASATPALTNLWRSTDADVVAMMRSEALALSLSTQPVRVPVIGGFLQRLRTALHNLTLFYTRMLANRQTEVNRVYGERLLTMSQINKHYQMQIDQLRAEIEQLRNQKTDNPKADPALSE